ncbi:LCP family protein [Corynebacterium bovis]|uniref:LCP family protein n=1 Tax=Corynebacterium bovis TaxID=36808 RepID=UPI003138D89C
MSPTGHDSDPNDPRARPVDDDVVRGRDGRPLRDRYGRPVRRRRPVPPPADAGRSGGGSRAAGDGRISGADRVGRAGRAERVGRVDGDGDRAGRAERLSRADRADRAGRDGLDGLDGLRGRGGRGRADAVGRPRRLVKKRYILAVVLVLILAVPVVMAFRVDGNLQRIDALKDYDGRPADSAGTNWLLVGTDSREGLSEADGARLAAGDITATGARTDSIIVVHVPRFGGKATMLSIPRDSYVDIPGWGKDKINTSFNQGGPALLQQTVEQSTGLRIDHYAEIGFGGFATIVDAVGGIELCPKEPIDDPMAGINLQPGCQTMDGPTALGYVRTRYTSANGDLDRVQRQREFLSAITHKVGSAGTVVNPFRSLPLADAFSKALTIDDDDHLWNLGALALALARGANQETVPVAGFEDVDVGNVVVWDDAAAQQLFASLR